MFSSSAWHGIDQLDEGDTWDPDWDDHKPLMTTMPAWTFVGAAVYKSLLDNYGTKPLPAFDPVFVPQSATLFNAAVGLAEIGVVRQLEQQKPTQPPTSEEPPIKSYRQYWEYGETFAWILGTAAAIAVSGIVGGGPKGRPQGRLGRSGIGTPGVGYSFSMRNNPAFAFMYSSNALRSVTSDVYGQLAGGYVPAGNEVIKESEAKAALPGEFGVGSAFAHGLTGYI